MTSRVAGSVIGKVSTYVAGIVLTSVDLGVIAVLDAEQDADGANISALSDVLWWSATNVTPVG